MPLAFRTYGPGRRARLTHPLPIKPAGCTGLAGLAEGAEGDEVAPQQRLLLGAGPAFELGFTATSGGKGRIGFEPQKGNRRVQPRRSTGLSGCVSVEPLLQIG